LLDELTEALDVPALERGELRDREIRPVWRRFRSVRISGVLLSGGEACPFMSFLAWEQIAHEEQSRRWVQAARAM
jgi:hypothetical protein